MPTARENPRQVVGRREVGEKTRPEATRHDDVFHIEPLRLIETAVRQRKAEEAAARHFSRLASRVTSATLTALR